MADAVLVTGAAGFAGSHLIDRLSSNNGATVVAWHRPHGHAPRPAPRVQWEPIDVLQRSAVADAIAHVRPSVVYHCAASTHVGRAWSDTTSTLDVNVRGTHYLLDALRRAAVRAVVLVPSSAMVYRPSDVPLREDDALIPPNPYGLSKLAQEQLAIRAVADGIDVRVARAFNHVGARQDASFAASGFAKQIAEIEASLHAPEIVVGNLDAEREVTDVRDTVRAYETIAQHGRTARRYNVASGRPHRVGDVLERLLGKARIRVSVRVDPDRLRPNDIPRLVGDPTRIQTELGWEPEIPLDRTLEDLLDYWRSAVRR